MSATTVLPDPTSPCSSRCIGAGRARSAVISAMARVWSPVSGNGSAGVERGHERAVDRVHGCRCASAASARLRATSASCMRRNSSNFSRCAAADASCHRLGAVDAACTRSCGRRDRCSVRQVAVERVGEAPRLRALAGRRDRPPELPGVHLGLPRLRVHGHDRAGDVGVAGARRSRARARRRRGSSSGACRGSCSTFPNSDTCVPGRELALAPRPG